MGNILVVGYGFGEDIEDELVSNGTIDTVIHCPSFGENDWLVLYSDENIVALGFEEIE